jgi:hypothetical protein
VGGRMQVSTTSGGNRGTRGVECESAQYELPWSESLYLNIE